MLSLSAKDLSYLLVGETSQWRNSDERKASSDPPNNYQQALTKSITQSLRDKLEQFIKNYVTQSKSKTIITRSMCVISLIVFTDKDQRTCSAFYTKMVFHYIQIMFFKLSSEYSSLV